MDKLLSLLGLAKKAGRLCVGEESVGTAARAKKARLLLLASDASDNTARRASHFAEAGACLCAALPCTKAELGRAVGLENCAMAALTDWGFASAAGQRLTALDPSRYGALSQRLETKARRAQERREEARKREKSLRAEKRKKSVPNKPAPIAKPPVPARNEALPDRERHRSQPPDAKSKPRSAKSADPHSAQRRGPSRRTGNTAQRRWAHSRPVKKGKGSFKTKKP